MWRSDSGPSPQAAALLVCRVVKKTTFVRQKKHFRLSTLYHIALLSICWHFCLFLECLPPRPQTQVYGYTHTRARISA